MVDFAVPGLMPITSPKYDVAPRFYELEPHCASDTNWIGMASIGPVTINDEAPVFPAARALMIFTPQINPERVCVIFDSEEGADGIIEIADPETWFFEVIEQPLPVWPGMWRWEFKVIDSQDVAIKLYEGQILVTP